MSQVRKFKDGGGTAAQSEQQSSTEAKKKYRLIINGKEMLLDDDSLAAFRKAGSGQGGMMGNVYADIADALQAGKTVKYNSDSNTISGVDFKRVDPTAIAKANENQVWDKKAQRRANRYARRNNLTHQFNSALASIGNINFYNPEDETTDSSDSSSSKLTLFGSYDPFEYNVDDQGNKTFAQSPLNATAKRYIDAYADLVGLTRDQAKEKYNFDDERYDQLMNWYNTYGQGYNWSNGDDSLWSRIQSGNYNENDDELLKLLGWDITKKSEQDSTDQNGPRSYEGSGFNNEALKQAGYYVKKGSDGNTYLYDNTGQVVRDSIYLRDTPWATGTKWAGGAVYQGRLWTPDEIFNQNTIASQAIGSELFDRLSGITDPEQIRQAILSSPWKVSGTENPYSYYTFDSSKNYLKGFMDSLNNGTYYYTDISNKFNAPDDTHILAVMSGDDRDRDNMLKTRYAVSGYSQLFDSIDQLQNYLNTRGITSAQGYRQSTPISQYSYVMDNGKRYIIAPGERNIAGKKYNLYRDEEGRYYVDGNDGKKRMLTGTGILDAIKNGTVTAEDLLEGNLGTMPVKADFIYGKKKAASEKAAYGQEYTPGSYDQIFGFKKGGRIPIMQMGGYFSSGRVGQSKENEQVENWVGQPQKMGADKRLKTKTDTLNKTAGWLDAAGLATSWIPGVGTGVGILGSLARFGADVKKDGFQWKDAGNLAINLGLDALTLIPGLGAIGKVAKAGSKAAKLVKTSDKVAKVAKAVSPLMSAAGATTGAAQIYGAINNPDGMTSEDFGNLLSGIANVGLGSKNLIKNYKVAKVAKKLSGSKPVETKDAFKIGDKDKWLKRNAKKVGNFGNRMIHAPENFAKNNGSTLNWMFNPWKQSQIDDIIGSKWQVLAKSPNQFHNQLAAEYLVKNPIESAEARTIRNKIYNGTQVGRFPWRNPKYELTSTNEPKSKPTPPSPPTTSTSTRLSTRTPEEQALRNQIAELLHKIRNVHTSKGTYDLVMDVGYRGRGFGGEVLPNKYDAAIKARPELREMIQHHINQDRLFHGFGIDDYIKRFNLSFKQGGKIIKAQPGTKMPFGIFVTDSSSIDPNLFNYQKSGIQFNDSNVDWTKTYGDGTFMNYRQQYLNNWDNATFKPVIDAYLAQLSKGNNNVDLSNFSKEDFARLTQDQKLGYAHNLYTDAFANYLKSNTPATVLSRGPLTGNAPTLNIPTPELGTPAPIMSREELDAKREENIKADGSQAVGGQGNGSPVGETKSSKGFNWDPDTFIGLANLGYSVHKNNQMYGVLDDAIRKSGRALQKEMPTEIYDRYQDHITPIYQEAANNKRQFFIPTSTDALTNYAMRQTNEDAAQQLLTEGRLKASEAYSQYLDKDLAARRAYADARRETANQNRAIMASTIMQLGQNDAARRLANNQSVQNFVMEFRNKLAQDKTKRDNLIQSYYTTKAQNDYNTAFRNYLSNADGKNYYQLFKEATDKAPNETFEDWLYRTDMNAYNKANEAGIAAAGETRWNGAASALNWFRVPDYPGLVSNMPTSQTSVPLGSFKSGGKTPKYMQRHTGQKPDEAIWIQRNKDTAKALEKLHDAVIKLFMKTLS